MEDLAGFAFYNSGREPWATLVQKFPKKPPLFNLSSENIKARPLNHESCQKVVGDHDQ